MDRPNIFPMNSLVEDPNMRGDAPLVTQLYDFSVTLVAGVLAVDDIPSPIALADVVGAEVIMKSGDIKGDVTGVTLIEAGSSGTGYLKITVCSSLATSTAAKVGTLKILGRIVPVAV